MTKKLLSKNQQENYMEYLQTFDLGAAASLITSGFQLISLDKANPRKVQFNFLREAGIEAVLDDYWSNNLEVRARTFFDNMKMLKNRIYSE